MSYKIYKSVKPAQLTFANTTKLYQFDGVAYREFDGQVLFGKRIHFGRITEVKAGLTI